MGPTIVVDGTDLSELGALSNFAETLPQPKLVKVSIPAGMDLDITDSLGRVGYANGKHTFDLYLLCETELERSELERDVVSMLQGRMLDYALSWDEGYTYTGRFVLDLEYLTPRHTRVAVTVDRAPWKVRAATDSHVLDCHPTATHTLEGSSSYHDLKAAMLQGGTTQVGSDAAVTRAAAGTYALADGVYVTTDVTVTVDDWRLYVDGADLVVKDSKFSTSGKSAAIDATGVVTDLDLYFADADLQRVTVTYQRWDL